MLQKHKSLIWIREQISNNDLAKLTLIWILAAIVDRLWFALDNSVPAWDQSAHLTGTLSYWQFLHHFQNFQGEWWTQFWQLSNSYRGPFVYLITVPFLQIFGLGYAQAALVNLLFSAIIIISVYYLSKHLFNAQVGLWSAGFCLLFPANVYIRTDYLIDYGLTAVVIASFTCLTFWKDAESKLTSWLFTGAFGIGLGLIMLTKPTGFFFVFFPGLWLLISKLFKKQWEILLQVCTSLMITWLVCGNWYHYNWLTIITSALAANRVGISEGDPGPNTLAGWLYYWQKLPEIISFPLLFIPIGCLFLSWNNNKKFSFYNSQLIWVCLFCLSGYVLCSLGTNKDIRFILPLIPGVSIILSYFFTKLTINWAKFLRWATVGLTLIIVGTNLFFQGTHLPYRGVAFPHAQVIAEVLKTSPYLQSNIGVIDNNTAQVNAFTFDYYGKLANFQVYARELKPSLKDIPQAAQALSWYMTRSGEPNASEAQIAFNNYVQKYPQLKLHKTWTLPGGEKLYLYHRIISPLNVQIIDESFDKVKLEAVTIAQNNIAGKPVAVNYRLSGNYQQLQQGIILLNWQRDKMTWVHDHGIALGQLSPNLQIPESQGLKISEHLAMLLPATATSGKYTLKAVYLNRQTGKIYDLEVPTIESDDIPITPELNLITQLQELGKNVRKGDLDQVFKKVAYLNLYDPIQDYLLQAETAFSYRFNLQPQSLDLAYTVVLAQILQKKVAPVLHTLEQITQVDPKNAYAWTYLGFVHLYNFDPQAAEKALAMAESLNPTIKELKSLKAIAQIMQWKKVGSGF